jgi:hypothetical protein
VISALIVSGITKPIDSSQPLPTPTTTVISIERDDPTRTVVTGTLYLNDVYFCDTSESRIIPPGHYYAIIYKSPKFKHNVVLLDVAGRSGIEIHSGSRSKGCIILPKPDFDRLMPLLASPLYVDIE